jgi:hypothetical protein
MVKEMDEKNDPKEKKSRKEDKRLILMAIKMEIRKLENLRSEFSRLIVDECKHRNLPSNMQAKDFFKLLRRYHGLYRHCFEYHGRREPIYHKDLYDFYSKVKDCWTLKDVDDLIEYMGNAMNLTKEKATAKLIVDMATEYVLLYEFFMDVPSDYEKGILDKEKRPVSMLKSVILR